MFIARGRRLAGRVPNDCPQSFGIPPEPLAPTLLASEATVARSPHGGHSTGAHAIVQPPKKSRQKPPPPQIGHKHTKVVTNDFPGMCSVPSVLPSL